MEERAVTITPVFGCDNTHIAELAMSSTAMRTYWPGVFGGEIVVIADESEDSHDGWMQRAQDALKHRSVRVVMWGMDGVSQREKMLTAFVLAVPPVIQTTHFAKVDTDAFPTKPFRILEEWFDGNPVLTSAAWGYSKPADVIQRLDDWGDTVPEIAKHPRLNIPFDPASGRVVHTRISSHIYFGRTDWHQWLAKIVGDRLPVPSQDTVASFVAQRTGAFYRRVRFGKYGFKHVGNGGERLKRAVEEALA